MNIYDFDKTIFRKDCSVGFYFFCFRKKPFLLLKYLLLTIVWYFKYSFKRITFKELKENMYSFTTKINNIEKYVEEYWQKNIQHINKWYYDKQKENDCVITASFDFIIDPICKKLNIKNVISTKYDLKKGKIVGENNHDFEKVKRFNAKFKNIVVEEAYSDSKSDIPMLELAKKAFIVEKDNIKEYKSIKDFKKNLILLSFLLTFIIFIIISYITLISKNKSILICDLFSQYISFFNYYRETILHGDLFTFSFVSFLGSNVFGLFAYYLSSPFNLLFLFSNTTNIDTFIYFVIALKISLCSMTMCIYLKNMLKTNDLMIVILSICYGLMSYNMCYLSNVIWLDGMIWLPIIVLGINKLINKNEYKVYLISLTICILSNFYIAYQICIFTVLYFIAKLIISKLNRKEIVKRIKTFTIYSLFSGLLCAFLLIPTIYNMFEGKVGSYPTSSTSLMLFNPLLLINQFIPSYMSSSILFDYPHIYSSIFVLILTIMYFLNNSIKLKERITYFIFLLLLMLSLCLNPLNLVFHLFSSPVGYIHRNAFLIPFLMITLASISWKNIAKFNFKKISFYLVIISLIVIGFIVMPNFDVSVMTTNKYYSARNSSFGIIAIALLIIYIVYLYFYKQMPIIKYLIIILLFGELSFNAYTCLKSYNYKDKNAYQEITKYNNLINNINDNSFYRLEKDEIVTYDDSHIYYYNGFNAFNSTINQNLKYFFQNKFNLQKDGVYTTMYKNNNELLDSFLGMKYFISQRELNYEVLNKDNEYYLYQNNNYLPIIFANNKNIIDLDLGTNIIDNYNKLYQYLTNTNNLIFKKVDNALEYINCDKNIETQCELKLKKDYQTNNYSYVLFESYNFEVTETNTSVRYKGSEYNNGILLPISNKYPININMLEFDKDKIKYYEIDATLLANLGKLKQENRLIIKKFKQDKVVGTYYNEDKDNIMMTTIPYVNGWGIKVNGKYAKTYKIMDNFLAFDIKNGNNDIEIIFETPRLNLGIIISTISLFSLICYNILQKKKEI